MPAFAQTSGVVQTTGSSAFYYWVQEDDTIRIYNHTAVPATCSFEYSSAAQGDSGDIDIEANGRADTLIKPNLITGFTLCECHPAARAR